MRNSDLKILKKGQKTGIILVAQMKKMTTKLQLLLRFNAASLATNLTTTIMYNTISNGIIINFVRSLHDQVARVNNYCSKPAT